MHDMRELRYKASQDRFRLPQSRLQASTQGTYTHDTRPFSNGTSLRKLRTMIVAGASATSGYNVHIHIKFLPKSWPVLAMTFGIIKMPEFRQKEEDSHPCYVLFITASKGRVTESYKLSFSQFLI